MSVHYGLYAYGLVDKHAPSLPIMGIDKQHNVFPIEGEEACVMVSRIDVNAFQNAVKMAFSAMAKNPSSGQNGTTAILQAHEDVIESIMQSTTVVPFKFGTILKDEQAAAKMLLEDGERFKRLLAKLSSKAEWGLRVYADAQQALRSQSMQAEPAFSGLQEQGQPLSKGATYLLGRKMEAAIQDKIATQLASACEAIFQEMAKAAYEAKLHDTLAQKLTGKKQAMILNTAYLIEKGKESDFCEQAERLTRQYTALGLDLEVSGPWPPYSFIS